MVVNVIQPYNNAALLAVPLDHATINQGNSELEKVGDKVLELAKEMVGSYPHKVEYDMEVGHPSERIIALSKKWKPTRSFWAAADSAALLNFPGQRQFQGFSVCNSAGTDRKIITELCLKF